MSAGTTLSTFTVLFVLYPLMIVITAVNAKSLPTGKGYMKEPVDATQTGGRDKHEIGTRCSRFG